MTGRRVAVVGGGILGTAIARRILQVSPDARVTLLEKESALATHQTGRNSGVVHAGLYYQPGSLKARLCRRGVGLLREFCQEHEVAYDECGKLVVALDHAEHLRLQGIFTRAQDNGVPGVRMLDAARLREVEPHVRGVAALHSPTTAIVDYVGATNAMADDVRAAGGTVHTGVEVTALSERGGEVVVGGAGPGGAYDDAHDQVVVCAGLQTDRVAGLAGDTVEPMIVPFRGEYYLLRHDRRNLVRGNVYPVPDPRYPFLGLHLTPRVDGEVMVGPNAVLALGREAYRWRTSMPRDVAAYLRWPGFRRFARQHWRTGIEEMVGSLSKRRFVARARRYLPELTTADVVSGPSGNRAQALDVDGSLVDDFRIHHRGRVVCVRNAPSPAATSALAIAEHLVDQLGQDQAG